MDEFTMPKSSKGKSLAKALSKSAPSPKDDAASDVLAAMKASDPKALSLAMTRFYEACSEPDEDDEEYESEEA